MYTACVSLMESFNKTTFKISPLSYKTVKTCPTKPCISSIKGLNFKNGVQQQLTMPIDSTLLADNRLFYAENQKSCG
ncbi:hypothetical protein CS542_08225 [Pedobacter sp. IW39]|nr:hypothetical protein CS542_08225 [Pedobacter sp. IW39]